MSLSIGEAGSEPVPTEEAPGSFEYWSGSNRSMVLVLVSIVSAVTFFFCAGLCSPRWPWFILMVLACGALWLVIRAAQCYENARQKLKDAYREMHLRCNVALQVIKERDAFISVFHTSVDGVDQVLRAAAAQVARAYAAELDFHLRGLRLDDRPGDTGLWIEEVRRSSQEQRNELRRRVDRTVEEFDRLCSLAKSQKYVVKPSWQSYVVSVSEGVEGRNEPPGQ